MFDKKALAARQKKAMTAPLGAGQRFEAIKDKAEHEDESKVHDAEAIAASAGIKKYGKARMEEMAQAGKK